MQYKNSVKIVIDKRKFEMAIRLGCDDKLLLEVIKNGFTTPTGDALLDELLETMIDVKEFSNWGGTRKNAGRKSRLNQDDNQLENQDENQDDCQLEDKDKDKDIDIDNYIFKGEIIKLNKKDYSNWERAYPELNLYAELLQRDLYLKTLPEADRKKWFITTAKYLMNQNEFRRKQHREEDNIVF